MLLEVNAADFAENPGEAILGAFVSGIFAHEFAADGESAFEMRDRFGGLALLVESGAELGIVEGDVQS